MRQQLRHIAPHNNAPVIPLGDWVHVAQADPAAALDHLNKIRRAVLLLDVHPEIGRSAARGSSLRELIISHGKTSYVPLYEYSPAEGVIRVVAIRSQREAGHRGA
jgi:plasmid stabilization system protein ParE